ncbi:hypothetical protein BJV74DRAFT_795654 [Russula compacta]|nr:hypothetical protein BJV74DRAFT_795654 [Russula compacta]
MHSLPAITEVTILCSGGYMDEQAEQQLCAQAPDAIIWEVKPRIAKALANPIPLRAGRWSIQPHSKGNFMYSFNGHIPFNIILSYKWILLDPFHGTGQLCPSLGWMQLLTHRVPFTNDEGTAFNMEDLQAEVWSLPGLRKVFFAMAPRWLKLVSQIDKQYSSITFAISDPDGSIANTLMKGRLVLFGKEVVMRNGLTSCLLSSAQGAMHSDTHRAQKPAHLTKTLSSATSVVTPTDWATTARITPAPLAPFSAHGTPNMWTETETKVRAETQVRAQASQQLA